MLVRWGGGNHFGPIDCPRKFPFIAHSVKSRMNIRSLIRGKHPTLINRLVESHLFRLGSRTSINPLKASPHYSNFSPFHSCDATLNILRFNFENFVFHTFGWGILTIFLFLLLSFDHWSILRGVGQTFQKLIGLALSSRIISRHEPSLRKFTLDISSGSAYQFRESALFVRLARRNRRFAPRFNLRAFPAL